MKIIMDLSHAYTRGMLALALLCHLTDLLPAGGADFNIGNTNTMLTVVAGANAPRIATLRDPAGAVWTNRAAEQLIAFVEIDGRQIPTNWRLNSNATRADSTDLALVYENAAPHLRLTSHWQARADFGPIEHGIRIENLVQQEIWLPLQDSFRFEFAGDPRASLKQAFVEKGAGIPSDVGTHLVNVPQGYEWTGMSSTYAHPKQYEPREIIPWFLVQETAGVKNGWYVGIQFSGRTRLSLERTADSLKGVAGLNPNPAPFRTCLKPGDSFETPSIFLGASHGGLDAAGNVLRRWIRKVLGNPNIWNNPNYPLIVNRIEYFDSRVERGVVYAFHGTERAEHSHIFRLQGIHPDDLYRLHYQDGRLQGRNVRGKELMNIGFEVDLPIPNSSGLIFFEKVR